jgi:hypothetical protein
VPLPALLVALAVALDLLSNIDSLTLPGTLHRTIRGDAGAKTQTVSLCESFDNLLLLWAEDH